MPPDLTKTIATELLRQSNNIHSPDFEKLTDEDLFLLFNLYDLHFFAGRLTEKITATSPAPLAFRVSPRMSRAGGKTTRTGRRNFTYEIAIASRLLFLSFADITRPIRIGGLPCCSRLDALQRIMEHEIIHLHELLEFNTSSCHRPRFKKLINTTFHHTEVHHDLITPAEAAATKHQITVGSLVRFEYDRQKLIGRVNRITHRATILVETPDGRPYSDGKRYDTYYIPLTHLRLVSTKSERAPR